MDSEDSEDPGDRASKKSNDLPQFLFDYKKFLISIHLDIQ